jgi:hypothetical protein
MKKQRTAGAERLFMARRAASKELRLPTTDWRVKRYAVLACAHSNIQARLAVGADISVDNLLKLDAAMAEIRSSVPQEPVRVEIEYVEGPIEHCPKCGWHRDEPLPPSDPQPPTSPPPEAKPLPPAASASNVVPIRGKVGGSIHDAVLPNGQPARMTGASYGFVGGGSGTIAGPFSVKNEPRPNFESKHSLPNPGGHGGSVCW